MTTRKVNSKPADAAKPNAKAKAKSGGGARYRRLPTGAHGLTREEVERDQRERLRSAMIELIAERGYPAVRILDLTQLAHVSRPTFYNLFADKEELLLSAYEDIAGRTTKRVGEAYASGATPEQSVQLAGETIEFLQRLVSSTDSSSYSPHGQRARRPSLLVDSRA